MSITDKILLALSVLTIGLFVSTVILFIYYKILDRQIRKYETEKQK